MGISQPASGPVFQRRVERISQAVVRVDLRGKPAGFAGVRTLILEWLRKKAEISLTEKMLRGETDSLDLLGAQRVETVSLPDGQVWAARQDFQDDRVARRTWVTEAMLASVGAQTALLGFRLHCVTSGDPAPFSRSIPNFMREVAKSHNVWLDNAEIDLQAHTVETEEDVDVLFHLLADSKRRSPVIGISMEERAGQDQPLIDADRLARAVFGTAHVRLLTRGASFWLTDRVGKRFSAFNGAIRIWWPNFSFEADDPYDHPLWLADHVRDAGETTIREDVTALMLKASAGRRDADEAIPSFAEARRAAAAHSREIAANSGQSAEEMLRLYETENARLLDDLKDAKAESDELIAIADEELRQVTMDRDAARDEVSELRKRVREMEHAVRRREQKPDIEIPDSFEPLAAWAALYVGDTIELLPRALNAAKKSIFDNPPLAYQALLLLHEAYVPMRRSASSSQVIRDRWDNGLRQLRLDYSQAHSSTRAGENPSDYFVMHNGRKREIDMHLKGSNSRDPRYCFRLYFFWDDDNKRVVVAWLPSHLGTRIS